MKKTLSILLAVFFCQLAFAQKTGSISGKIFTSDGLPAQSVSVTIANTKKGTETNEKGEFEFKNLLPATYTVTVSSSGFSPQSKNAEVQAGKASSIELTIEATARQLEDIMVLANSKKYIATKTSEQLRLNTELIEVPQNITVTTKQLIQDMGLLSKSEVARTVSGLSRTYGEELDMSFSLRGMDATNSVFRNGIGGPIWWDAQEDAGMIERIEFIKGPAGFMLANAEPGGLINVVTKQPVRQRISQINIGTGSYNLMRANIDLGGEIVKKGPLTYRLNTGYQQSGKYYKFGNSNRYFICPAIKYDFSENTSITFEYNFVKAVAQENEHRIISADQKLFTIPSETAINDPNMRNFTGYDHYARVFAKHKINDHWDFNAQVGYVSNFWGGYAMSIEGISPTKDTIYRDVYYAGWKGKLFNTQLFANGYYKTGKNIEHKILAGLDLGLGDQSYAYGNTWGEHRFPLAIADPVYFLETDTLFNFAIYPPDTWGDKWTAIYLQDHIKFFDKLVLTLAGRYTFLKSYQSYGYPDYEQTNSAFTPRLGVTYLFSPDISAYALYDQSFLPQQGRSFSNEQYKPLTGNNTEIGVKGFFFNKQLMVNASAYNVIKKNVLTPDPLNSGFSLPTGEITSSGIELDVSGNITRQLSVNANFALTNARITEDSDSVNVGLKNYGTPDETGNLWMKYRVAAGFFKGFDIGAGMQYMGRRSGIQTGEDLKIGNRYLPGYTIFDASLSYEHKAFGIGINVYNLADKKYAATGWLNAADMEWIYAPGMPLNFRLQASIRF